MQIQSWLLQKPTDLHLRCLQMQDISRFSRTRVNLKYCEYPVCVTFISVSEGVSMICEKIGAVMNTSSGNQETKETYIILDTDNLGLSQQQLQVFLTSGPEVIKLFFMLNSADHEHKTCPTNKSQITNNCKCFLAKHSGT